MYLHVYSTLPTVSLRLDILLLLNKRSFSVFQKPVFGEYLCKCFLVQISLISPEKQIGNSKFICILNVDR